MHTSIIVSSSHTNGAYLCAIAEKKPAVFSVAKSYVIRVRSVSSVVSSLLRDAAETCLKELPETTDGHDGGLNKLAEYTVHCLFSHFR